jgi:hypothetical protein
MSTYHHDYAAFDRLVLCAPFMVAEMLKRAEKVKARAELTAPYDAEDPDLVHYRDHFEVSAAIRVDQDPPRLRPGVQHRHADRAVRGVRHGEQPPPSDPRQRARRCRLSAGVAAVVAGRCAELDPLLTGRTADHLAVVHHSDEVQPGG